MPQPVVVITGGAGGLGRVIAGRLARQGEPLVLVDRDADALRAATAELSAEGSRVHGVVADLSRLESVREAAAEVTAAADVRGLVNNAGGWSAGQQFPDAEVRSWCSGMTLNLLTPMILTQLFWPTLAAHAGAVVNIGSSGGEGSDPYGSPEYGAAKAGLRRFTEALGDRTDVRVCAVVPGWVGLPRAVAEQAALPPDAPAATERLVPPEDVANAVVDLLVGGAPGEVRMMLSGEPGTQRD